MLHANACRMYRMNEPNIDPQCYHNVQKVLESGWLGSNGPFSRELEGELSKLCGCNYCVVVSSGTAALYGALKALGVSNTDQHVICQSFTCAACTDAVVHAGGTPVIVDVELDTFSLDFTSVSELVTRDPQIVGILLATIYGCPARDLRAIRRLCTEKKIWLLEDNCESYGASANGVPVGCIGDMSVISLRSEKMIGAGEGGAILSNNSELVNLARWWCSRAPDSSSILWLKYCNAAVGQNFLMPELTAALGVAGAGNMGKQIAKKRLIHSWYMQYLSCVENLSVQNSGDSSPIYWINAFVLPCPAEPVGTVLQQKCPQIEIRPGFYPLHRQYGGEVCSCSERLYQHIICLPSSTKLEEQDVAFICEQLRDTIQEFC